MKIAVVGLGFCRLPLAVAFGKMSPVTSFSTKDRIENIRRIGEVAKLFMEAGVTVLAAFISPCRADRDPVTSASVRCSCVRRFMKNI